MRQNRSDASLPNRQVNVNDSFAYLAVAGRRSVEEYCLMGKTNRIREVRDQRGLTLEQLAEKAGFSESYLSRMESGGRNVSLKNLARIAAALGVPDRELVPEDEEFVGHVVGVIGDIAAGGRIDVNSDHFSEAEPLFEIKVPFSVPSDAVALRVSGDSMWPRYDPGDVIICYRYSQDPRPLIGSEAAVGTPDGSRYLKRILKSEKDERLFDLDSHNAGLIRDVEISWVSEVYGVVRASRWEKLSDGARRREMRKAVA